MVVKGRVLVVLVVVLHNGDVLAATPAAGRPPKGSPVERNWHRRQMLRDCRRARDRSALEAIGYNVFQERTALKKMG